MEETLKKFIYSGLGLLSLTTTKIIETVEGLIKDRKITEEEGKRIMDDLINKSKGQRQEFEDQFRSFSSKFEKASGTSAEEEIEKLRQRIEALEAQLNISPEKSGKPASVANPSMEKKERSPVEKVEQNERVSLGDEVLTPEKKMEAEKKRMQEKMKQDKKENNNN